MVKYRKTYVPPVCEISTGACVASSAIVPSAAVVAAIVNSGAASVTDATSMPLA